MINRIRDIRREKNLTLADVAARCSPPTTAQTIGRLETGMRNLSLVWMNRIAAALGVEPELLRRADGARRDPVGALLQAVVDHDRVRRDARLRRLERDRGGEREGVGAPGQPDEHRSVDALQRRAHGAADLGGGGVETRAVLHASHASPGRAGRRD